MRQAGRYLLEYNYIISKSGSFLQLAKNPKLSSEVTPQPNDQYGLDAAILFSEILTITDVVGLELSFEQGEGPKLERQLSPEKSYTQTSVLSKYNKTLRKILNINYK